MSFEIASPCQVHGPELYLAPPRFMPCPSNPLSDKCKEKSTSPFESFFHTSLVHILQTLLFKMDTILPLPFLPNVDLATPPSADSPGFTRKQLSYLGCVHFTATDSNIDQLMIFLQRHVSIEAYVDVSGISAEEDIITILDSGAKKVFVTTTQLAGLTKFEDRVVPIASAKEHTSADSYPNGVLVRSTYVEETKTKLEELSTQKKASPTFLTIAVDNYQEYITLATSYNAIPIIPFDRLTISGEGKTSVPSLIASSWTSDRADKLIPTMVTDERGIALGLVYSSQESLAESLKTGTGVYQSRKRGLWYKGATSGDVQELVRVSLDCDQDCLKFVVRQKGRGRQFLLSLETLLIGTRFLPSTTGNVFR